MSSLPLVLAPFAAADARAAVGVDYDGALAPIVTDPARAVPLPAALDALAALVTRVELVAIVSGRPVSFLRTQVVLGGVVLVGQYGLERLDDGEVVVDERALAHVDAVRAAADAATRAWPDLLVERKGDVAFTVHWRRTPSAAPDPAALAELAHGHSLMLQPARMAAEFRPPVPTDKGTAFEALLEHGGGWDAAAFVGDDAADLAAFDALDRMERAVVVTARPLHAARIAVRSDEAPPELLARADVVVDGPPGVADLLSRLAQP
jgi:trehalose 6-phosphate phosphatase